MSVIDKKTYVIAGEAKQSPHFFGDRFAGKLSKCNETISVFGIQIKILYKRVPPPVHDNLMPVESHLALGSGVAFPHWAFSHSSMV